MATLTNTKIKDTYDGLLKTTDNDVIGASEKVITDGLGNASVLSIGTASASFSSDIEVNGLTIGKGNGSLSTNVAVGVNTLDSVTGGVDNTAIGHSTMQNLTLGVDNAAFGTGAMVSTTTGSYNTSIGSASLPQNTTGSSNTAVGLQAMQSNNTGGANTVVGMNALNDNSSGNRNTALGFNSGNGLVNGDDNVYIGYNTDSSATDSSNEIVIGSGATGNGSNTATYGNSSITDHHFTSGTVRINSDYLRLTGATNPQVLVTDTTNSVSVGLQALDASTKIDSTHSFKIEIGNDIIQSVTSSGVEITGNLAVDTNTLYVDAANNKVGINNSTPNSFFSNASQLVVGDGSTSRGMTIYGSSAGDSQIFFADGTTGDEQYRGAVRYEHSSDSMVMFTSGSEKIRIDSSGNVGIGLTGTNSVKLGITGNSGLPATSGTTQTGLLRLKASNNATLDMGADHTTATGWLQVTDVADLSNEYNLLLQPNGGNVGIGGIPNDALEVAGNTASAHRIRINNANASGAETLIFTQGSTIKSWIEYNNSTSNLDIWQYTANDIRFGTNNGEKMRIDSSGNVGIGGTLANTKFYVTDAYTQLILGFNNSSINYYDADTQVFRTRAGGESMRIDSSGNVSIGSSTAFGHDLFVKGKSGAAGVVYAVGNSSSHRGEFAVEGSGQFTGGFAAVPSGASTYNGIPASTVGITTSSTPLVFATSNSERMRITSGGAIQVKGTIENTVSNILLVNVNSDGAAIATDGGQPAFIPYNSGYVDGQGYIGLSANRWNTIYATTGTINTSDANEKQQIEDLNEVELRVATKIKSLIKKFKYNDAVELKGDNARIHIGVIAQDVKTAFESEGLDANNYGLFCSDTWWESYETIIDEEGNEKQERIVHQESVEGSIEKTRLGIRYEELLAFVIAAL